jgi:hypothetical protein
MHEPLDKQKALLYGQFVQAAYAMFKNPNSPDPLKPEPQSIPDSYELGAWIHMSDFFLDASKVQFYGIVAHEIANPSSRVVAIRGTEGIVEWMDDAAALLVPFRQVPSAGRVSFGFDKIYSTLKVVRRIPPGEAARIAPAAPETFTGSFAEQLEQFALRREAEIAARPLAAPSNERPKRPTIVAGHSLGAALATLFVMENDAKRKFDLSTLCTFGSPRVGNKEFVRLFNSLPIDSWRLANKPDVVPRLPLHIPLLFDYEHVNLDCPFDSSAFARTNPSCSHAMETYLHWLDATSPLKPECVL